GAHGTRLGLTDGLSGALDGTRERRSGDDPGRVLCDRAVIEPADIATTPVKPTTCCGSLSSPYSWCPVPSCPTLLSPHAATVPAPSARLKPPPADPAATPLMGTATGTSKVPRKFGLP